MNRKEKIRRKREIRTIGRAKFEEEKITREIVKKNNLKSRGTERKRVEIEGGIEEGSWRFRRKKMTFRDKLRKRKENATRAR